MTENTITLTLQEYEHIARKAWKFDLLKEVKLKDRYLDDLEKALFEVDERGTENANEK